MTDLSRTRREIVHYFPGRAAVAVPPHVPDTEVWRGPLQELRARLRDEIAQGRVSGDAWEEDVPGLPRGWRAVRVRLVSRRERRERLVRKVWRAAPLLAGVAAITAGAYFLVKWFVAQIALLVAGFTVGAGAAAGIVAALLLLAAGGTTTVVVVTKVTVRRGWF